MSLTLHIITIVLRGLYTTKLHCAILNQLSIGDQIILQFVLHVLKIVILVFRIIVKLITL
jgi:hypothetical protein